MGCNCSDSTKQAAPAPAEPMYTVVSAGRVIGNPTSDKVHADTIAARWPDSSVQELPAGNPTA
jgi:hypothetical protein